ncbi:MAG: hypothetical protein WBW74_27430 [Xanthobacteraceae bacterium]
MFERLRRKRSGQRVFLYAFDLLELNGQDLRREPIETRKARLASLLRGSYPGLHFNEHLAHPGDVVFRHACKMGFEGIVSKRLGSRFAPAAHRTGSSWTGLGPLRCALR